MQACAKYWCLHSPHLHDFILVSRLKLLQWYKQLHQCQSDSILCLQPCRKLPLSPALLGSTLTLTAPVPQSSLVSKSCWQPVFKPLLEVSPIVREAFDFFFLHYAYLKRDKSKQYAINTKNKISEKTFFFFLIMPLPSRIHFLPRRNYYTCAMKCKIKEYHINLKWSINTIFSFVFISKWNLSTGIQIHAR